MSILVLFTWNSLSYLICKEININNSEFYFKKLYKTQIFLILSFMWYFLFKKTYIELDIDNIKFYTKLNFHNTEFQKK